jgi:hypothetical protein
MAPAKEWSASMRKGFLLSVGAWLAGAGLALGQVPYGYRPAYYAPYPPAYYGYYPQRPAAYGYYPSYAPAYYNYAPQAYAPPQGYVPPQGYAQPQTPAQLSGSAGETSAVQPVQGQVMITSETPAAEQIQSLPTDAGPGTPPVADTSDSPAEQPPEHIRNLPADASPGTSAQTGQGEGTSSAAPSQSSEGSVTEGVTVAGPSCHGSCCEGGCCDGCVVPPPHCWANVEYLNWKIKEDPIGVPLVTTGNPFTDLVPGAIGQRGTQDLSPRTISYPEFNGSRLTLGGWFDSGRRFGMEVSGFLLETRSAGTLFTSSPANGGQPLFVPFNNPLAGAGESALIIAEPAVNGFPPANGSVAITGHAQLWGFEANALYHAWGNTQASLGLLAGFRYFNLEEQLLFNTATDLNFPIVTITHDGFGARNQFYGGQVGAKVEVRYWHVFANLLGKIALGDSHEAETINGVLELDTPGIPPRISGGGIFAQPTNISRQVRDEVAVLGELQAQLGYEFNRYLRGYVGYNVIYLSNAQRPGNMIDRNINGNLLLVPPILLVGPQSPAPVFRSTDFWAQGVNVGIEVRY